MLVHTRKSLNSGNISGKARRPCRPQRRNSLCDLCGHRPHKFRAISGNIEQLWGNITNSSMPLGGYPQAGLSAALGVAGLRAATDSKFSINSYF